MRRGKTSLSALGTEQLLHLPELLHRVHAQHLVGGAGVAQAHPQALGLQQGGDVGEVQLPLDVLGILREKGRRVGAWDAGDPRVVLGANDQYIGLCRKHWMAGDLGPDFRPEDLL